MSTTVTFFEELHISKNSPKGAETIQKLKDYIHQYNEMKGIEDLTITYMELICGDMRASVEDQTEVESGNTWRITQNGLEWQSTDHVIWKEEHPLMLLLGKLCPDQEIVFRLSGSMTRVYLVDYTYRYWLSVLKDIKPEDGIDCKVAEAADTDTTVSLYHLNGSSKEEVPRDGSIDLVGDIPMWFSELFEIKVSVEDEEIHEEFEEEIGEAMQNLIDGLEDEFLEPDIFEGEAELSGSLELRNDQLPEFLNNLQAIADIAKELGAMFECTVELLPEERTNNGIEPFAVLQITGRDGKIEVKACRF